MAADDPLRRLQTLQRDLLAFTESRLPNLQRLVIQLESSVGDFKTLLARTKKNEASRAVLIPKTGNPNEVVTIDGTEYQLNEGFRQAALLVADELDLDEVEAVKLCLESPPAVWTPDDAVLPLRALINFHQRRETLLDCLRLILQLGLEVEEDRLDVRAYVKSLVQGQGPNHVESSAYWRKCVDGLSDVEHFLQKTENHRQMMIMTGQSLSGDHADALQVQHQLVTRQHECLASILSSLIHGNYVQPEDYRAFLSKAAGLEAPMNITIHYLPVLMSGAHYFGSDLNTTVDAAKDLHNLFATGPGQLQWKQPGLKAAATVFWLAEYSSRFALGDNSPDEVTRARASEECSKLFFTSLSFKAFHFILAAATFLKPVLWFDPSRVGLVDFLLTDSPIVPADVPQASDDFAGLTMRELQSFTDAFVTNMPDAVRKLKTEEDESRRKNFAEGNEVLGELDLERFMVIMACAYQDDTDATRDFWSDRESNLYGFLRWSSQRLPTPRVAAFCQLLRSIACDEKSANHAHLFLVEDTVMTGGKLRKTYSISWSQIFSEFETFAKSLKDKLSTWEQPKPEEGIEPLVEGDHTEPETGIMLDSYLSLATHICRMSPDARTWILKEQPFHLGENMIQLASANVAARVRACCLDLLSALLVNPLPEVRNGIWALLDGWISSSPKTNPTFSGSFWTRPPPGPPKRYLEGLATNAETCASLINLLNALMSSARTTLEAAVDILPFPEQLETTQRQSGSDRYVDFVLQTIFARKVAQMTGTGEASMIYLLRCDSLDFILLCLSTFNENLVFLANTSSVGVEDSMETKSLANYVRLHPFARIMEWLLNSEVTAAVFAAIQHNPEEINEAKPDSPLVQSTLKAIQVLNLAWKLQPTYFDIVKPALANQPARSQSVQSSNVGSIDEIFLLRLETILSIASLTTCRQTHLSLESLALFKSIGSSRRLTGVVVTNSARPSAGNRVLTAISSIGPSLTLQLRNEFLFEDWDFEQDETSPKYVKTRAILDLLNASLDVSEGKPTIAHCLLGLRCHEGRVTIPTQGAFQSGVSLFHEIARCAVEIPVAGQGSHLSWLLAIRRGCVDVLLKLSTSNLTASIVRPELRAMQFLEMLAPRQFPISVFPLWDFKLSTDPAVLLDSSALAIRDFLHIRESVFELYAAELRHAAAEGSYSIQERLISMLRGVVVLSVDEKVPVASIFDLSDFFELQTTLASDVETNLITSAEIATYTKLETDGLVWDTKVIEELLLLRKRELTVKGIVKEPAEEQQVNDEVSAIVASLNTQDNWTAIYNARLTALEAWTDLLALMVAKGGMSQNEVIALAIQGLLVALPRYEKSLVESPEASALLAKLILTLTHAITPALQDQSQQTANVAMERLQSVFRVSLKAITDSTTDVALRDVCYRTCCAILASAATVNDQSFASASPTHKQLLQMVRNAGDRLIVVITEDTLSGRGITRISALLLLDGLVALFQKTKVETSMLRSLTKLNFVPVLIDTSIGSVASIFGGEDELVVSLSYFHTALALLLRLCQSAEGTQVVLNANLFEAIEDSNLFSTDPDIGFDIDNPEALREFYRILTEVLRVVTAAVLTKGAQAAKGFLQTYRPSVQAIFKRTSRESGPPELLDVANEMEKLILTTGFLEDDAASHPTRKNGFT